jgi:ankyrin repeat protein
MEVVMSEETRGSASGTPLPDAPNLDWLRKQAKRRLAELRRNSPEAKLADAQFDLAKQYGFPSWRALKSHVDSLTVEGQLFDAARAGDVDRLTTLLDAHPDKLRVGEKPYAWTLLHAAAHTGRLAVVNELLKRGLDVNTREKGDDTYPMHWAAAAGHLDVVRRLADAGGDVVGHGDDHELEVIGWATCWNGCDDDAHRAVANFLISRGAHHHIFSAIAMNLGDEVRRIVAADPAALTQRMSRNENHQLPIHFAVRMNRAEMVALLFALGADPAATDDAGSTIALYAASPDVGRYVFEAMPDHGRADVFTALAVGDEAAAERLLASGSSSAGALHLTAKRGDVQGVKWLLAHGADPNGRWTMWGDEVFPLHFAAHNGHADVVRALLDAGADPTIRDRKYDGDAIGWAEHGGHPEIAELLRAWVKRS